MTHTRTHTHTHTHTYTLCFSYFHVTASPWWWESIRGAEEQHIPPAEHLRLEPPAKTHELALLTGEEEEEAREREGEREGEKERERVWLRRGETERQRE